MWNVESNTPKIDLYLLTAMNNTTGMIMFISQQVLKAESEIKMDVALHEVYNLCTPIEFDKILLRK
jgi:hypothetical protein